MPAKAGIRYAWRRRKTPRRAEQAGSSAPRGDDAVLGRLVEIGVHGEADHLLGEPFAHRRAALGDREMLVALLAMQRHRIVDRGRDALALERNREPVAPTGLE